MTAVLIVGIVFGSIVAIVAIIFGFVLLSSKTKREGSSFRQSGKLDADETRLIQEIHKGISKMENRVDALETILFDREAREISHTEGKEEEK
jgi:phage shock protein B